MARIRATKARFPPRELEDVPGPFADAEALARAHCGGMADAGEGVAAWIEKRAPNFTGA
ncbi:MAG: hypothetical protein HYZ28_02870 [Myxococcales bacterium]|nr:hypothetical protein [Myxococcales bacterium]